MKRLTLFLFAIIFAISAANSQTLDEIIKQYSVAIGADKLASVKTVKATGRTSTMGMEMPVTMFMKSPNKIKMTTSFMGQEMIMVFDGVNGYIINTMLGSAQPAELTGEQLRQLQNNNIFNNNLLQYYNNKQVTLEGTENINGSPAYKLKINVPEIIEQPMYMFIDQKTGLPSKMTVAVEQMGVSMNVESFISDYINVSGVVMPKKTSVMMNGMEVITLIDQIEVDIPIDDSMFTVK